MRIITGLSANRVVAVSVGLLLAVSLGALAPASEGETEPETRPVGTMADLMSRIVLPTSDAVLYIGSRTPENDEQWAELQAKTLMLAESARLLLLPGHTRNDDLWREDSLLLLDAGRTAFEAAAKRDVDALSALNDPLYTSCVKCHEDFDVTY